MKMVKASSKLIFKSIDITIHDGKLSQRVDKFMHLCKLLVDHLSYQFFYSGQPRNFERNNVLKFNNKLRQGKNLVIKKSEGRRQ